jgi:hypothetical protein
VARGSGRRQNLPTATTRRRVAGGAGQKQNLPAAPPRRGRMAGGLVIDSNMSYVVLLYMFDHVIYMYV